MKKLLSLLSVLTISGTAVPTTIAASPYQKQIKLKNINNNSNNLQRKKRNIRCSVSERWNPTEWEKSAGNEFTGNGYNMYFSFTPNLWEEIIIEWYNSQNVNDFKEKFKNKLYEYYKKSEYSYWAGSVTWYYVKKFAENLWNRWDCIIKIWRNSNKQSRIRIISEWYDSGIWANIRNDDTGGYDDQGYIRENKYLNKQLIPEIITNSNLGDILIKGDTKDEFAILDAIKTKNPIVDISQIYVGTGVGEKTSTSAKIIVKEFSNKYSFQNRNWVLVHFNLKYE